MREGASIAASDETSDYLARTAGGRLSRGWGSIGTGEPVRNSVALAVKPVSPISL